MLAFLAASDASVVAPVAQVAPVVPRLAPVIAARLDEFDPNPQYSFAYDVQDGLTGDSKSQVENRNGDIVQGQYSLIEPDGTRRTVDYTADPVNGFNAIVSKTPLVAPIVAKTAPLVAAPVPASPVVAKVAAPAKISAPLVAAPALARYANVVASPRYTTTPVVGNRLAAPLIAAPQLGYSAAYAPYAYSAGFAAPLTYAAF